MKAALKSRRPTPEEALAIATSTAPPAAADPNRIVANGPRKRYTDNAQSAGSIFDHCALMKAAQGRGLTMKQVVCQALDAAGVAVALADWGSNSPAPMKM